MWQFARFLFVVLTGEEIPAGEPLGDGRRKNDGKTVEHRKTRRE
jgi:hypothetical protein